MDKAKRGGEASAIFIINWRSGGSCSFSLAAIDEANLEIAVVGYSVDSTQTSCVNLAEAIRVLTPLASPEMDWLSIDGHSVQVASDIRGRNGFVPSVNQPGVECLERTSTVWESAAATEFSQQESVYRYENLYWVEAIGDSLNRTLIVGWYSNPNEGLAAAAQASEYLKVESPGSIQGMLDN